MLVFSPSLLPQIFDSLVSNFSPKLKDATPANTLYMLARFACLTCDHIWLDELIIGAADAIEETFFVCCLAFVRMSSSFFIYSYRTEQKTSRVWYFGYTTPHYGSTSCSATL